MSKEILTREEYGEWRADRVARGRTTKKEDAAAATIEALAEALREALKRHPPGDAHPAILEAQAKGWLDD